MYVLNHRITKYDGTLELHVVRCITFSFIVGFLYISNSCIFAFGESVPVFLLSFGCSSVSLQIFGLYWLHCPRRIFFQGYLLVLDISGFAGICSCRVLFSVFITSLFIPFQLFWLVGVSNSVGSISCRFIN